MRRGRYQQKRCLNGWLPLLAAFAGGSRPTQRLKTHSAFSARSWCSERGRTSVLCSIIMGKRHSAKRCDPPHPASLTTVRGIIGTTGCASSPFPLNPSALSPHEAASGQFRSCRWIRSGLGEITHVAAWWLRMDTTLAARCGLIFHHAAASCGRTNSR